MIKICCKVTVRPLNEEIAALILAVGQFYPTQTSAEGETPHYWRRDIPEENASVNVSLTGGEFGINLAPSISHFDHHLGKRITAGVYFEIAAKYAEKVNGEITQRATVDGCKDGPGGTALLLAQYPDMPLMYARVCNGFQQVILHDHGEDDEAIATG